MIFSLPPASFGGMENQGDLAINSFGGDRSRANMIEHECHSGQALGYQWHWKILAQ